jgi:hypothetical protein
MKVKIAKVLIDKFEQKMFTDFGIINLDNKSGYIVFLSNIDALVAYHTLNNRDIADTHFTAWIESKTTVGERDRPSTEATIVAARRQEHGSSSSASSRKNSTHTDRGSRASSRDRGVRGSTSKTSQRDRSRSRERSPMGSVGGYRSEYDERKRPRYRK